MDDGYTKHEQSIAEIVAKWIVYYGGRGLDAKAVTPDSMICFNIVKEISELAIQALDAIRAEARAEALERAEMALALMFEIGEITRDKAVSMLRAAILAAEPKEAGR